MIVGPKGAGKPSLARRWAKGYARVMWVDPSGCEPQTRAMKVHTSAESVKRALMFQNVGHIHLDCSIMSASEVDESVGVLEWRGGPRTLLVLEEYRLLVGDRKSRTSFPRLQGLLRLARHHNLDVAVISHDVRDVPPDVLATVDTFVAFGPVGEQTRRYIQAQYGRSAASAVQGLDSAGTCTYPDYVGDRVVMEAPERWTALRRETVGISHSLADERRD